jgi:hypothetical protein
MRSRDKLGFVGDLRAELKPIEVEWVAEVREAVRERSAWACIGQVEIEEPSARQTLGGFIDRRIVPLVPGVSAREVLEQWSHTTEGKLQERLLQKANGALTARLPPAQATATLDGPWVGLLPAGPIALVGRTADLVHVMRLCRTHAEASRFRACAGDESTVVSAVGMTPGLVCTCVVSVALAPAPGGIIVVGALEIRSHGAANIPRIDLTW